MVGRNSGPWSTSWDPHISRQHVECRWNELGLHVVASPHAENPVFWKGQQHTDFLVPPGGHFVIGDTMFTVSTQVMQVTIREREPVDEQTFSNAFLQRVRFRDAAQRIEVLNQLPDLVARATTDEELCLCLANLLLAGIPRCSLVAIMTADSAQELRIAAWDKRDASAQDFQPSERLIRESLALGQSVVNVWASCREDSVDFTIANDVDWAFCTPLPAKTGSDWAVYVAGGDLSGAPVSTQGPLSAGDLRDDVKFTELVATTVANIRALKVLEQDRSSLRQFFSPPVVAALERGGPETTLAPRETEVSVLFCDLRGFARKTEAHSDDLMELLHRVSDALEVLTRNILDLGGVVGDFHGDAAMGFWGWPLPQADREARACRAARAIRSEFHRASQHPDHPLHDFRLGIGIASGRAVAGKIGTRDQVKVTVFGPVVNLASRLESMTKTLQAPILMDAQTAHAARQELAPTEARVRRLAVVRPYGMQNATEVSELLPPESELPSLTEHHLRAYERALAAFISGDWDAAYEDLHRVPAEDRAKDFLTVFIARCNRLPPADWDGIIPLQEK